MRGCGIEAWARLIYEAGRHAGEAVSFRAASVALEFALHSTRVQVSPLLRVSFPLVYAHLRSTESTPSILSFFSFHDWDRCKTARKDLARAFISSVWPPADLLRIADEVMEVESFSWILGNAPGGRDFLVHALDDPRCRSMCETRFLAKLRKQGRAALLRRRRPDVRPRQCEPELPTPFPQNFGALQ